MQTDSGTNGSAAKPSQALVKASFRYANALSESFSVGFNRQLEYAYGTAADLTSEIAVLRRFVEDSLVFYESACSIPDTPTDIAKQQQKLNLVYSARMQVDEAVQKVERCAYTISRIHKNQQMQLSLATVQELLTRISSVVGSTFGQYEKELQRAGVPIEHIINDISDSITSLAAEQTGGNGFGTGPVISTVPSRITTDQVVTAMDETIPLYCDEPVTEDELVTESESKAEQCTPLPINPNQQVA